MVPTKTAVLIIDDDVRILRMLQSILEAEGYRCLTATSGEAAVDVICQQLPDLVLLDIVMPGMDGYKVCKRIREFSQIPIIMVTAKNSDQEIAQGLEAGADDYVVKPFRSMELMARVKAVLRRTKWEERHEPGFHSGDLSIDFAQHKVSLKGEEILLSATEYRLLSFLARNAGRVLTPSQILEKVWGEEYGGEDHLLRVNMARLRQKIRESGHIVTRIGIGYEFVKLQAVS